MPYSDRSGVLASGNRAMEGASRMEQNHTEESATGLVTESLVEEVSIDGMCGVY